MRTQPRQDEQSAERCSQDGAGRINGIYGADSSAGVFGFAGPLNGDQRITIFANVDGSGDSSLSPAGMPLVASM